MRSTTVAACLSAMLLCARLPIAAASVTCIPYTIEHDSTHANGYLDTLDDALAIGQTFYAPDALVESITVWAAYDAMNLHMYVADARDFAPRIGADAVGNAQRYENSPPYQRVTWQFSPPIRLPGPGLYAFFLEPTCGPLRNAFHMLVDTTDGYPGGRLLEKRITVCDWCECTPSWSAAYPGNQDLCFNVTYCGGALTATKRTSWGELRLHYR